MENTLAFEERVKGFPSFFGFIPDMMVGMNNRFFSWKNGDLYEHHIGPINEFYGENHTSKIVGFFNEYPEDDKIFKTIVLEGDRPWKVTLKTNYTESTIDINEFEQKESRYFAYIRKNEDDTDLNGVAQGVGIILSFANNQVSFSNVSEVVSEGDKLFQLDGNDQQILIGTIQEVENNVITLTAINTPPVNGYFAFSKKDSRIDGSEVRGYYLEFELENEDGEQIELFAINTNAVKSYI